MGVATKGGILKELNLGGEKLTTIDIGAKVVDILTGQQENLGTKTLEQISSNKATVLELLSGTNGFLLIDVLGLGKETHKKLNNYLKDDGIYRFSLLFLKLKSFFDENYNIITNVYRCYKGEKDFVTHLNGNKRSDKISLSNFTENEIELLNGDLAEFKLFGENKTGGQAGIAIEAGDEIFILSFTKRDDEIEPELDLLKIAALFDYGGLTSKLYDKIIIIEKGYKHSVSGLPNRNVLELLSLNGNYGVGAIDINEFKRVNDRFGHSAGDTILREVGRILEESVRSYDNDMVFHIGGDEFIFLVDFGDGDNKEEILTKIKERITTKLSEKEFELENIETGKKEKLKIRLTVGMGIASGKNALLRALKSADDDLNCTKGSNGCIYRIETKIKNLIEHLSVSDLEKIGKNLAKETKNQGKKSKLMQFAKSILRNLQIQKKITK